MVRVDGAVVALEPGQARHPTRLYRAQGLNQLALEEHRQWGMPVNQTAGRLKKFIPLKDA